MNASLTHQDLKQGFVTTLYKSRATWVACSLVIFLDISHFRLKFKFLFTLLPHEQDLGSIHGFNTSYNMYNYMGHSYTTWTQNCHLWTREHIPTTSIPDPCTSMPVLAFICNYLEHSCSLNPNATKCHILTVLDPHP